MQRENQCKGAMTLFGFEAIDCPIPALFIWLLISAGSTIGNVCIKDKSEWVCNQHLVLLFNWQMDLNIFGLWSRLYRQDIHGYFHLWTHWYSTAILLSIFTFLYISNVRCLNARSFWSYRWDLCQLLSRECRVSNFYLVIHLTAGTLYFLHHHVRDSDYYVPRQSC
jgi:hypothetical protein